MTRKLDKSRLFRKNGQYDVCLRGAIFGLGAGIVLLVGCTSSSSVSSSSDQVGAAGSLQLASAVSQRVVAQGQIMPSGGIVKIYSAPGDVVVELPTQVGAHVESGQVLARLRSEASVRAQRAALEEQQRSALRTRENAIRQAELQVSAARLKMQQIEVRRQSVVEQTKLLQLAQQQVIGSEKLLTGLQNVANDDLTREFIGQMDIDRQKLAVDEARLKFLQQQQAHHDAQQEIQLAVQAAQQELEAAQAALSMAQQSDPAKAIEAQLAALDSEAGRSVITAPSESVVLAINASVGGAAVQTPLVELANIEHLVCEVEVNVEDAGRVQVGQRANIRSRAFEKPLTGVVTDKNRLVGRPRLRSLDPFAAVDYRTVSAIVALDDPVQAKEWLQLQVEVEIDTAGSTTSN